MLTEMREATVCRRGRLSDLHQDYSSTLATGRSPFTRRSKAHTICAWPSSSCSPRTRASCPHASALSICSLTISRIPTLHIAEFLLRTGWLPAYRLIPAQPKGTLVVCGGFDSCIEEWLPAALVFRDAGYDTILFEGPGQGAVLELAHLTMSPEWEKPVKAVLEQFRLDAVTLIGILPWRRPGHSRRRLGAKVSRVIAYDIMTNGLECFLALCPQPAQKELLNWINLVTREPSTSSSPMR